MGTITLSSEDSGSNSILSNTFIDYYMPEANGDFVKVYLYLLRLQQGSHTACSISKIADHLQCTDNDVERAIKYWIGKDLLQYSLDEAGRPVGLILCQPQQPASAQPTRIVDFQLIRQDMRPDSASDSTAAADASAKKRASSGRSAGTLREAAQPSAAELERLLTDENFKFLIDHAAALFEPRALTNKDINTLSYIYSTLELPLEVCECLLEYCADDKEKHPERMNAEYYKKIATTWAEQEVRTKADAKLATSRHFFGTQILRALGIRDRYMPTDAEIRMLEDWRTRFGFSDEMLILACETGLRRRPSSVSFDYVQGILESWYKQGFKTPQDVEKLDHSKVSRKASPAKSGQSDFIQGSLSDDLDVIEQLSLKKAKES